MSEKEECQEKENRPLGLKTESDYPVPLKSIKVDLQITGYVAEVSSTLTYYNEEKDPVEAVFTFPVDDGSAVFQFEADIDGRHIVAEIQQKEQAELTYKDAMDHGKTAMLLKEDNSAGDIFSCMLGNLPPESEASLVMKYVIELPQEPDGRLRFTLPTVLNPRYSPDAGSLVAAEGATYVPPCRIPYDFSMTTTVQGYHEVASVTSDKVKLDVEFEDNNKTAKATIGDDFKFDHDLCLLVQYNEPFTPQIVLEDGNPEAEGLLKKDILMVSFHPDLKEVAMATSGEYIFVIDRSGSMMGEKMNNAKEALLLFLKSLPPDCYFNIISFGSSFSSLFSSGSKKYSEESLQKAVQLQKKMDADLGGTEILKPLKHIFSKKQIPSHPRRVFVLTDGQACNTNEVIGLVRKYSQSTDTRVFSLGIGSGASTALIKGIASNGGGKAEFVNEEDRVQPKVISLLKCAMQSAITDIKINWDLPPDVTPIPIPTEPPTVLSAGERLTLFAILQGVDKCTIYASSTVTVEGRRDCTPVSYSMTFTLCAEDDIRASAPVHRLATKVQIKLLQDQESASFSQDDRYPENVQFFRKKIIDLSRNGNIISRFTAFVAIDTEGQRVEGKCLERPCPVPTLSNEFQKGLQDTLSCMRCCSLGFDTLDLNTDRTAQFENLDEVDGLFSDLACVIERSGSIETGACDLKPAKKKRSGGFLGCGPKLSSLFSKKSKRKKGSRPFPAPVDVVDSPAQELPTDKGIEDVSDAVDNADVQMSMEDTAGDRVTDVDSSVTSTGVTSAGTTSATSKQKVVTDAQMLSVVALQQLQGQWSVSEQLLQLLGIEKEDTEKLDFSEDPSVVCTVIVICWLRKQFSHRKDEWQMIETKAIVWISSQEHSKCVEDVIKQTTQTLWPE